MKWREFCASLWLQSSTVRTMGGVWRCHSTTGNLFTNVQSVFLYSQVYVYIMAEAVEPVLFTKVTVYSLLACVAQFAVGFAFAQKWGNKCSAVDRWVLVWLFYDAIVHFTLVSIKVHTRNAFVIPACNYLLASCLFHRAGGTLRLHVTCWKCSNFWQSVGWTMWVCCVATLDTHHLKENNRWFGLIKLFAQV